MSDQEAIDYLLLEIIANLKEEYNNKQITQMTEDAYIISRLSVIAKFITRKSQC